MIPGVNSRITKGTDKAPIPLPRETNASVNTGIVNGTDREPTPLPIHYIPKYCGHLHTSENSTDVIWILRYNNQDDNLIENCSSTVIKSSQYFIASG